MLFLIAGYVFTSFIIILLVVFTLGRLLLSIIEWLLGFSPSLLLYLVVVVMCVDKVIHLLVLLVAF
jgi:hypothetical protein